MQRTFHTSNFRQRGVTLIEVLIAMLVLGIGLLGVAALQSSSIRSTHNSFERTRAVIVTENLVELMRINTAQAQAGSFAFDDCAGDAALGTDDWIADVQQATRPGTCPIIDWDGTLYTIWITWDDERQNTQNQYMTQVMP